MSDPESPSTSGSTNAEATLDTIVLHIKQTMEGQKLHGAKASDPSCSAFWIEALQRHLQSAKYSTTPKLLVLLRKWLLEKFLLTLSVKKDACAHACACAGASACVYLRMHV